MTCGAVKVIVRPQPPVKVFVKKPEKVVVVVQKKVVLPPVRVSVPGVQGPKGDKGETGATGPEATICPITTDQIDVIFGSVLNGR